MLSVSSKEGTLSCTDHSALWAPLWTHIHATLSLERGWQRKVGIEERERRRSKKAEGLGLHGVRRLVSPPCQLTKMTFTSGISWFTLSVRFFCRSVTYLENRT